jgi:sterol desaturase/sphingolipid hydroxylase (fatty acid hydroxylase superfamily)
MSIVNRWATGVVAHLASVSHEAFAVAFLALHHPANSAQLLLSIVESLSRRTLWFLVAGLVVYTFSIVRKSGRPSLAKFSYSVPIEEPGDHFSLRRGLSYLLPKSFYSHWSFWLDMKWAPFNLAQIFLHLGGLTLGVGAVQLWLLHHFGHSRISVADSESAALLEAVIILLASDFGHYMWHFQAHKVPFFWEFHKPHHAIEVLHPFGVRNHPIDMVLRGTYMGVGGGIIAGTLIYLLGMRFNITAAAYVAGWYGVLGVFSLFEHTHVRMSYGKTLSRLFFAPYMHHFHHGAGSEHQNVNLGFTGGLLLWDYLFGTLYWPKAGEKVVWGASLEELGANNPYQSLWVFITRPCVEAFRVLLGRHSPRAGGVLSPREGV